MTNVEFTSQAVRSVKFREKLKGYHPEDVDSFLERAAATLDQLNDRLAEATARALKAEAALARNAESDDSVRKTLVLAQRTAEMAVREANEEATRVRVEAQGDAVRIVDEAKAAADKSLADARQMAAAMEQEAERTRAAAVEHATATVDEADVTALARLQDAERQAAALLAEIDNDLAARRLEAAAEIERQCDAAHREIAASVLSLQSQRDQLWGDVQQLSRYLASERARVLDLLTGSSERFAASMAPAPVPPLQTEIADLMPTLAAVDELMTEPEAEDQEEDEVEDEQAEAPVAAVTDVADVEEEEDEDRDHRSDDEPHGGAAEDVDLTAVEDADDTDEWEEEEEPVAEPVAAVADDTATDDEPSEVQPAAATADEPSEAEPAATVDDAPSEAEPVPAVDDEPPARLLFTLEDDLRRIEAERVEVPADTRGRKPLLGRRRG